MGLSEYFTPKAIPKAHSTPIMVSALCLAFQVMAAITTDTRRAKPKIPNMGERPKKKASPIPP
jgi:hypothetical protein